MYYLGRVATNLRSHSLLIPWQKRLDVYLASASSSAATRQPQLFARVFDSFDIPAVKERGIKQVKVDMMIKTDGTGMLVGTDDQLTDKERSNLAKDIARWQFFPPTREGQPFQQKVTVPMQF